MSESFLNESGLTRYNEKLLTEVDKRIAAGGNTDSTVPTYEEILEAANRVSDVEVDPSVAAIEALQTSIARLEAELAAMDSKVKAETIPVGTVIAMSANSAPNGYIFCDGSEVSRTTYATLFLAIGTTYGSGDGSTTFNVPNLVDKFIQGSDTVGTVKEAGLPNINGFFKSRGFANDGNHCVQAPSGAFYGVNGGASDVMASGTSGGTFMKYYLDASRSSTIYGKSTTVQPPALTMRFYIKH